MNSQDQVPVPDRLFYLVTSLEKKPTGTQMQQIKAIIQELINNDFAALVELLYRIDIDERKLKQLLKSNTDKDTSSIIADCIIDRQLQKIATRKQFAGRNKPHNDDSW